MINIHEFAARADRLIGQLAPRLDPQQAGFIRDHANGGDWDEAIDLLVATLAKRQHPISAEELSDLRQLVNDIGAPTDRLDALNLAAPGDTNADDQS